MALCTRFVPLTFKIVATPLPMQICSQAEDRNYVDASKTQLHNPIPAYTLSSHLNRCYNSYPT